MIERGRPPRQAQHEPRQAQEPIYTGGHEPRQAQEPIYNGGGGATPHGIYNCRPRASQISQSAAPNVAGVAGRKGAELRPQPLARGRAEEAPGSNSVYDEPPGQQF